jgi:hypothetical protein
MGTARVWVADVGGEEFKGWEEARAGNGDELGALAVARGMSWFMAPSPCPSRSHDPRP